jgi:uroporphyrinogen-III decarboxylase
LNNHQRFLRTFNGEPVDHTPFLDVMGFWDASLERWKKEGLANNADSSMVRKIVGFDGGLGFFLPVNGLVCPAFELQVVRQEGEKTFTRNRWGAIELNFAGSELLPITIEGPVSDRKSWDKIKPLLQPESGRLPEHWSTLCDQALKSDEPVYTGELPIGFFGSMRELMGYERLAALFFDDPDLIEDMLDTLCDLWISVYTRVEQDIHLDYFYIWEDMCYKGGPLISPTLFRCFLLPRYQRLIAGLRASGCAHILVDSDGDMRKLVPLWIEGGVDITFPWETQFGLDIIAVRRQYPGLGMIGGLDKHALSLGREAMDKELEKLPFMLERGRYIPGLDHGVPNDVSWDDYRYFFEKLHELIWKYSGA